jgi:aspartate/methionine/tyrosine aminotransferase
MTAHPPERTPIDLASGELHFGIPGWIHDVLVRAGREDVFHRYPAPDDRCAGGAAYISFLEQRGHAPIGAASLTSGAKEGIWLALAVVLDEPGRCVLLPNPAWPSYRRIASRLGAKAQTYDVHHGDVADRLVVTLGEIRPAAVILNFPHNPTGVELTRRELDSVVAAAARVGAVVISDEVYLQFRAPGPGVNDRRYQEVPRVVVDSASKWLALPGLRVGWISASPELERRLRALRSASVGATPSAFGRTVVTKILEDARCPGYVDDLAGRALRCARIAGEYVERRGERVAGCGPLYTWVEAPEDVRTPVALGDVLASVAPGSQFGLSDRYYRLCPSRSELLEWAGAA